MANRNATATLFGFEFQVNAAIVLILENIKFMKSVRVEGKSEDIEILLNNNSHILAQAKAVQNSSSDFSNVLKNLKKALTTLSEAERNCGSIKELIFITNSPNPFNTQQRNSIFLGDSQRKYESLPQELKNTVSNILSKIEHPLDTSKLKIQVVPFETDEDRERYKYVWPRIGDFLYNLNVKIPRDKIHKIWAQLMFNNGTKKNVDITLTKNDIIWPIIVFETDNPNYEDEDLDESEMEEVCRYYNDIINNCTERYEFVTKVLIAYNDFQKEEKIRTRTENFLKTEIEKFMFLFADISEAIPECTKKHILRKIIQQILYKRIQINRIKKEVNL